MAKIMLLRSHMNVLDFFYEEFELTTFLSPSTQCLHGSNFGGRTVSGTTLESVN